MKRVSRMIHLPMVAIGLLCAPAVYAENHNDHGSPGSGPKVQDQAGSPMALPPEIAETIRAQLVLAKDAVITKGVLERFLGLHNFVGPTREIIGNAIWVALEALRSSLEAPPAQRKAEEGPPDRLDELEAALSRVGGEQYQAFLLRYNLVALTDRELVSEFRDFLRLLVTPEVSETIAADARRLFDLPDAGLRQFIRFFLGSDRR